MTVTRIKNKFINSVRSRDKFVKVFANFDARLALREYFKKDATIEETINKWIAEENKLRGNKGIGF